MGRLLTFYSLLLASLLSLGMAQKAEPLIDVFPPKYHPGDIIDSTEHSDIENALQDVDRAGDLLELYHVAIGIASMGGVLVNPRYFLVDGKAHSSIGQPVESGETSLMLFTKSKIGIVGVKGVVTYEIVDTELMLAIMFSNPSLGINKFHFKIVTKSTPVNKDLVKHLDYAAWRPGGYEYRTDYGISVSGTMTDNPKAHLIVWIDTSEIDMTQPPYRYAGCSTYGLFKKRCWRECDPVGWCWSREPCTKAEDCDGSVVLCKDYCKSP